MIGCSSPIISQSLVIICGANPRFRNSADSVSRSHLSQPNLLILARTISTDEECRSSDYFITSRVFFETDQWSYPQP